MFVDVLPFLRGGEDTKPLLDSEVVILAVSATLWALGVGIPRGEDSSDSMERKVCPR